jgi:integrase
LATQRDAETFLLGLRTTREPEAADRLKGEMTIRELYAYRMRVDPPRAPSTAERYGELFRGWIEPYIGNVELRTLDSYCVREWLSELKERPVRSSAPEPGRTSIERARTILHGLCELALEDRLVPRDWSNPVTRRTAPFKVEQVRREPLVLEAADIERLAASCRSERDACACLVMAWGGLRLGEALGLQAGDVEAVRGSEGSVRLIVRRAVKRARTVGPPKTRQERTALLPPEVGRRLTAYVRDRGAIGAAFLFPGESAELPLNVNDWRRGPFATAARRAGVPELLPHDLRHSAASLWGARGVSDMARQLMLGHTSARTTARYSHVTGALELAALAALAGASEQAVDT